MIGELSRNWFGFWEIRDESGNESTLASTYYPPEKDDDITWSAGGNGEKEIAYYFGHLINPKINKITVETKENFYEDVKLFTSDENRRCNHQFKWKIDFSNLDTKLRVQMHAETSLYSST